MKLNYKLNLWFYKKYDLDLMLTEKHEKHEKYKLWSSNIGFNP